MMNKILLGSLLVLISIFLGSLFFVRGYHDIYWSHPATFIFLTMIGVCSALGGGFLVGSSLGGERKGMFASLLLGLGALIALAGGLPGSVALYLAFGVAGTGYWGEAPDSYNGDYSVMGLQILAFQVSIPLEIVGGFLFGLSGQKRV